VSRGALGAGRETLECAIEDGVARITLNRPEAMNAFNMQLKQELGDTLRDCATSDEVRALVLTGAGRAFSAGGDLVEMDPGRAPAETRARMRALLHGTVFTLARLEKPVVAAVNGHCYGFGLSLALACDITYAAAGATFSMAFTRVGLVPDGAAIYYLTRIVGLNRAKELVLTARRFGAEEALALGLATRITADEDLVPAAMEIARELAQGATLALGLSKRLLEQASTLSLDDAAEIEAYAQAIMMASDDHAEAVAAFRDKRVPQFRGS
jgi:2-(1,2-epoxy-1,2-dihydrophenyl)acetyl-CoA isomerase